MTTATPLTAEHLKNRIVQFVTAASLEVTPHDERVLPQLSAYLPAGTTIYVAHPARRQLQDVVRVAVRLQQLGFQARPHIIARAVQSERQLRWALTELNAAGIDQILLVAGDRSAPAGPYSNSLEVLDTGATMASGMKAVAVAGHPEGHKEIGPSLLWAALRAKQAFAERTGTQVHVVTQFGFNAHAVFDWQRHGRELGIALPIHVGLAGPTPLAKLIRFAMQCGIGASLHALTRSASALTGLTRVATTPEDMLVALVRGGAMSDSLPIVKPHFFCFGGSLETAQWLRSVREGAFELSEDCARFTVRARRAG